MRTVRASLQSRCSANVLLLVSPRVAAGGGHVHLGTSVKACLHEDATIVVDNCASRFL